MSIWTQSSGGASEIETYGYLLFSRSAFLTNWRHRLEWARWDFSSIHLIQTKCETCERTRRAWNGACQKQSFPHVSPARCVRTAAMASRQVRGAQDVSVRSSVLSPPSRATRLRLKRAELVAYISLPRTIFNFMAITCNNTVLKVRFQKDFDQYH